MTTQAIKTLFANNIERRIEEVIKVDQTDDQILRDEIDEYVATQAICSHYSNIFDVYRETPNKPHDGIAVWVSGFFGSGKSSFAKMLGLAISNRQVAGEPASERFAQRAGDRRLQVLLKAINEHIPTHAVIFDVSTDRGIRSGNQTLTEIMYGLFLQSLGYAKDLDLSELEIELEAAGQLDKFKTLYAVKFPGREWDQEKGRLAFAFNEASVVLHDLDPVRFTSPDSWWRAAKGKADITPGKLAERASLLMKRRRPNQSLMFVVDEVGQFVARDVQKMLDLQAIVQNLGRVGRGKHWLVVTSQEMLSEIVAGLDGSRVELARLMDRFPQELQVHLEPSDISEVTSRRVLSKNANAQAALGKLYDEHRGRLTEYTHLSAAIKLPELTRQGFIDLYPLLPYQVDLIIYAVGGLRTQGGASRHVGGANRTIIKLAQQLLINPGVKLAEASVGALVRLDQVYDLVESNIGSEIRAKIAGVPKDCPHPLAEPVAKVICLLQYVQSVHRTAENIAAALYPSVGADSPLASVKEALLQLEQTHKVRQGDDGYRIPTPAEDDWERSRNGINPKPGDEHRIHREVLASFWQPQPAHTLLETKTFKAGLSIHGRAETDGDLVFDVHLADEGKEFQERVGELRARSQVERKNLFWVVALNDAIDRETVELFRSKDILARKEREARTKDETTLVAQERRRQQRHQDELRRLMRAACLSGNVFFQGKDRSPRDRAVDVGKSASEILGDVLPEVFERFKDAAARTNDVKRGLDALFTAENLQGLPAVFTSLALLRDERGSTVFHTESGPLAEVLSRIEARANYGETASGRYLSEEFEKEPFGWDFEAVRLFVLSLLRAGKIDATSKGQTIDSATTLDARDTFGNNNLFKQASFRPKKGIEFGELVKAAEHFRDTFGTEIRELNGAAVAAELRRCVARDEDTVLQAYGLLIANRLPGAGVLQRAIDEMKAVLRGTDVNAISTFNAAHRAVKEAIQRGSELQQALSEPRLQDLARARNAVDMWWPVLDQEPDVSEETREKAASLKDLLDRETFYRELPAIEQHARRIDKEYEARQEEALRERMVAYGAALKEVEGTPGWGTLPEEARRRLARPFESRATMEGDPLPIPQIRADREACDARLRAAIAEVHRILDGDRIVTVSVRSFFSGGVETEEQLDAALTGIREECARLIGAGKKVIVQ